MRAHWSAAAVGLALLACSPTTPANDLALGCRHASNCAAGGRGGDGAGGSGGAIGPGGSGGDGSGGAGGSTTTDRCSDEMAATSNALLQSSAAAMGFGFAPEVDGAPAGGSVSRIDPDGLLIETDAGGTLRLGWPSELPLEIQPGARVVASRAGEWDLVTADTIAFAVYASDAFDVPRMIGALPDGPALEFNLDCMFPDETGSACGKPPEDALALRVGADGRFVSQGETDRFGVWAVTNVRAILQPGFQVGRCVAEARFVATLAAIRSVDAEHEGF